MKFIYKALLQAVTLQSSLKDTMYSYFTYTQQMALILKFVFFLLRLVVTYFRPATHYALDLHSYLRGRRSRLLPIIDSKVLLMSATKLAQKIRKREISAVKVMQIYIARMEAVQPQLNAYTNNRFKEALADARAVDEMLRAGTKTEEELAKSMPLLGVPFTCKEIIGVKGLSQTWGLKRFKYRKAPEDADAVSQYRQAGAIPVAVTNIPTFCLWWDTSNPVFGRTRNPYNRNRSAGGSSGGEASLISSAAGIIGIGNDLGGSIRIPASFCGIYGHKPSEGIISNKATWPEIPNTSETIQNIYRFTSTGPMCRYAEDLPLLVKVLCGKDQAKLQLNDKVYFSNVRVYYMEELPGWLSFATDDVKASVRKAVKHFEEEYNITANKLKIEELRYSFEIWQSKLFEACGAFQRAAMADNKGQLNLGWELLRCMLGHSEYDFRILYYAFIEIQEKNKFYFKCLDMYAAIEKKLAEILEGDAILILPVHPEPPPHPSVTIPKFQNIGYTCIFNILGLPGTAIPAGMSEGVPIGLQVLAKKNNDHLTLAAAIELNKIFGGWRIPCPIIV